MRAKSAQRKTKLAIFALAILSGLLIIGNLVKFVQAIFTPWQAGLTVRKNLWNGEFNINVLIKAKELSLLAYSPQKEEVTVLDIPDQTFLQAGSFGSWQVRSVYNLGGGQLLKSTITDFFGLPIDGYLDFSEKFQMDSDILISEIRKDPFFIFASLPHLKTDLTPFELLKLKMEISSVRFDKIQRISLENLDVLQKERLADGTEVFVADPVKLDSQFSNMIDPKLQSEHKTIAIFNSTSHPGLAQKAARIITNIGGNVIIITNSQNQLKFTKVIGEKSKTLDRLKQIFHKNDTIEAQAEDQTSSRAEINIFLGEDYAD